LVGVSDDEEERKSVFLEKSCVFGIGFSEWKQINKGERECFAF
jgi:hypothetical protein